jgi:hypothetical protein
MPSEADHCEQTTGLTTDGVAPAASDSPLPALAPELKRWLEQQHKCGREALHKLNLQREQLRTETRGLDRFSIRMALVEVTGAVAGWTKEVHDGLSRAGHPEAALVFAPGPPFPATDPTSDDCDRLGDYLEARMKALQDLLNEDLA